jgi:mono/diheme cytochrome c family protein
MRAQLVAILILVAASWQTSAQQRRADADEVAQGRSLAIQICANCHVVARDQPTKPILTQPTPSFASIARRNTLEPTWLKEFLASTHRGADNPTGMPNPDLLDSHARQIISYLMSLRSAAVSIPIWDVTPSCRGAANAGYVAQTSDQLQICINREQRTREQLERAWATFPILDRNECIQSIKWFEPTYSELATCLEMRTQVRNAPQPEAPQRKRSQ